MLDKDVTQWFSALHQKFSQPPKTTAEDLPPSARTVILEKHARIRPVARAFQTQAAAEAALKTLNDHVGAGPRARGRVAAPPPDPGDEPVSRWAVFLPF